MFGFLSRLRGIIARIPDYRTGEPPPNPSPPPPHDTSCDSPDCIEMDFARSLNCCLSEEEVLVIIAPVVPDQLRMADRYRGLWEAYWIHWNDIDHRRLIQQARIEASGKASPRAGEPGSMVARLPILSGTEIHKSTDGHSPLLYRRGQAVELVGFLSPDPDARFRRHLATTALIPHLLIRQCLSHPDNRSSGTSAQGQFLQDSFLDLRQTSLGFLHGLDQHHRIEG